MIKISHNFPLQYYLDKTAYRLTDFVYCSSFEFVHSKAYRESIQAQLKTTGECFLDNSIFARDPFFRNTHLIDLLTTLRPKWYLLPGESNEEQLSFFREYSGAYLSTPVLTFRGLPSITQTGILLDQICKTTSKQLMIGFKSDDIVFENLNQEVGYFNSTDISYIPLLKAQNRKMFLKTYAGVLKDNKICLLGCETIAEFDSWNSNFNKNNIDILVTDHPVDFSLESPVNNYSWGFFNPERPLQNKLPIWLYKPELSFKNYPNEKFESVNLEENITLFQERVHIWSSSN